MRGSSNSRFERGPCLDRFLRFLVDNWGQAALEEFSNFFVVSLFGQDLMAIKNAPGIGIYDEDGMVPGIEKD